MADKTWVVANENGIITGASCEEDEQEAQAFLLPVPRGSRLVGVEGSAIIGAHVDAPMVFPPANHPPKCCSCGLPLSADAVDPVNRGSDV